jgi:SAM-dependent methyltransferase
VTGPAWYLDEAAHGGPEHLDPDYVARYDTKAGVDLEEQLALLLANGLDAEATLVDVGAGTGLLALAAAPHCRRVVAVDTSPAMLAVARGRRDSARVANVDLAQAGFLTYEHEGEPPKLVYTRNALHHLPDFWKGLALARVHDLLAPGGTLVLRDFVYSFEPRDAEEQIGSWLARAAPTAAEGWTRAELEEHVRSEHSTFAWLLEPLLERAGFDIGEATHHNGVYATYVCVAR